MMQNDLNNYYNIIIFAQFDHHENTMCPHAKGLDKFWGTVWSHP